MIQSFGDKETERIFDRERSKKLPGDIQQRALSRLRMIAAAETIEALLFPPSNQLHTLKGDRKGRWAIRINDQWRVTFVWGPNGAENVKIEDYH